MALALPAPIGDWDHDDVVILRGLAWSDYERILAIRGDAPIPRLTYLEGALELMSPSKSHESRKSVIGRLVEAWCLEKGVDISPFGSWTLKHPGAARGAEPDECYIVGDRDADVPDLAIEVVQTSGGLDKLAVYVPLGVREIWIFRDGAFAIFGLRRDAYQPIVRSEVLPGIDLVQLASFVAMAPMTRAVRAYRAALRG